MKAAVGVAALAEATAVETVAEKVEARVEVMEVMEAARVVEALHLSVRRHHLMGLLRVVAAVTATAVVVKAEVANGVTDEGGGGEGGGEGEAETVAVVKARRWRQRRRW